MRGHGLDKSRSEWGKVAGCRDHENETSGSIKCGEILD